MGAPEATALAIVTAAVSVSFVVFGARQMRRARQVRRTPTTSAAKPEGGGLVEVKGLVAAAEESIEAPLAGREAVWAHTQVEEYQDSGDDGSWLTLVDEIKAFEFQVDDESGRTARVVPLAKENGIVTGAMDAMWHPLPSSEFQAKLEAQEGRPAVTNTFKGQPCPDRLLALLAARGWDGKTKKFDPTKLRWRERALFVGDPVYVLGPAEVTKAPPMVRGYRSAPSESQLVMRGTATAPLTIAAMTEERYIGELTSAGQGFFGCAGIVAVLGLILSLVALTTQLLDCHGGD